MADSKYYIAIGEETTRGTPEITTLGYIPVSAPVFPDPGFDDRPRVEMRGYDTQLGDLLHRRYSKAFSVTLDIPFYTEAGVTASMIGMILKHFFGTVVSTQNATTGQYAHMFYRVADPFAAGNLGAKALTLCQFISQGADVYRYPWFGARVKSITFEQEVGQQLKMTVEFMGQGRDTGVQSAGAPAYPAENLRCNG